LGGISLPLRCHSYKKTANFPYEQIVSSLSIGNNYLCRYNPVGRVSCQSLGNHEFIVGGLSGTSCKALRFALLVFLYPNSCHILKSAHRFHNQKIIMIERIKTTKRTTTALIQDQSYRFAYLKLLKNVIRAPQ
jgi:hypothetical protein